MVETMEGQDNNDEIPVEGELHIAYPPRIDDLIAETRSRTDVKVILHSFVLSACLMLCYIYPCLVMFVCQSGVSSLVRSLTSNLFHLDKLVVVSWMAMTHR